jgi:hypothetical protein
LGSGSVCLKLHTVQNHSGVHRGLFFTKLAVGWDGLAVNPGVANSGLGIIVWKGRDSETLLTSGGVSRVQFQKAVEYF